MPSELRPKRTWLQKPLSASMGAAQLPATRLVANWKRGLFPTDTSYLIEAAKLERLARGEPTERVAEEVRLADVRELTDDELARIVASRRGLSSPGG